LGITYIFEELVMRSNVNETLQKIPTTRLIRIREVMNLVGLSKSHIYYLAAQGKFPKRVSLVPGGTSVAWLHDEIIDWLEGRVAERDGGLNND
jgi:prophage regulatory protein